MISLKKFQVSKFHILLPWIYFILFKAKHLKIDIKYNLETEVELLMPEINRCNLTNVFEFYKNLKIVQVGANDGDYLQLPGDEGKIFMFNVIMIQFEFNKS